MLYIPLSRAWVLCKGIAPLPLPGNFSIFEFVHGLLEVIYHRFSHIDTNANPRRSAGTHLVKIYYNALTFSIVIHNAFFLKKKKILVMNFFSSIISFYEYFLVICSIKEILKNENQSVEHGKHIWLPFQLCNFIFHS